jgi:hypothetical protein
MTGSDRVLLAGLLAAQLFASNSAIAETDEQRAVSLFERGRKLARDGRCTEAIPVLLESLRAAEGVGALLNLGSCSETQGKTATAFRYFVRARDLASQRADPRREEAGQRAKTLEHELPMLVVHVPPSLRASAEVRVDGEAWPRDRWEAQVPIDPGPHTIELVAPPHPKETATVSGARGTVVEWTASSPSPPSSEVHAPPPRDVVATPAKASVESGATDTQRTLGFVLGGVGLGALTVGAITGVLSITAHSTVVSHCPTYPSCPSSDRSVLEADNTRAQTTGTIATISLVAGAALLVGGAILLFTSPPRSDGGH